MKTSVTADKRFPLFSVRLIRLTAIIVYKVRILNIDSPICFLGY